jgi:hypothetical protein
MLGREMDPWYWARLTLAPVRILDRPVEDAFPEGECSVDTLRQFMDCVKFPEIAVPVFAGTTLLKTRPTRVSDTSPGFSSSRQPDNGVIRRRDLTTPHQL